MLHLSKRFIEGFICLWSMNVVESSKVTCEFPVLLLGDSLECIKLHLLFTLVELEILATWRASSMACEVLTSQMKLKMIIIMMM